MSEAKAEDWLSIKASILAIEQQLNAVDKDDIVQQVALIVQLQSLVAKFTRLLAEAASNYETNKRG